MIIDEIDFDYRNYILNIYYALVAGAFMFKLYIAIVITDNTLQTREVRKTRFARTILR